MFDFSGKVVIVTGGSRQPGQRHRAGVSGCRGASRAGRSFARALAGPICRSGRLARSLSGRRRRSDRSGIGPDDVVDEAINSFGRIDVLVNTVGGYRAGTPLHETPLDTLDFMFNLNVRTVFIMSQAVIPHMLSQQSGQDRQCGRARRAGRQKEHGRVYRRQKRRDPPDREHVRRTQDRPGST